jgi:hypothetical protein
MQTRQRLITFLVIYHGLVAFLCYRHWLHIGSTAGGALLAFALPTVQITWCFLLGLVIGTSRRLRPFYVLSLLATPLPGFFVYIATMLAFHFVSYQIAATVAVLGVAIIGFELAAGIAMGIDVVKRLGVEPGDAD